MTGWVRTVRGGLRGIVTVMVAAATAGCAASATATPGSVASRARTREASPGPSGTGPVPAKPRIPTSLAPASPAPASPVATRTTAPPGSDARAASDITAYLNTRRGQDTVAVRDMVTGRTFTFRPSRRQETASIVKVDILATLLHEAGEAGEDLPGDQPALATQMIEYSDNQAATDLWNAAGGPDAVARFDAKVPGMTHTTPDVAWGLTETSARDQVALLRVLTRPNHLLTRAQRAWALGLMEHVTPSQRWGISAGVPSGATVALKNGWLPLGPGDWQINSIGAVTGKGRHYLVAVLTTGNPTEGYGIATIEGVARRLWTDLRPAST